MYLTQRVSLLLTSAWVLVSALFPSAALACDPICGEGIHLSVNLPAPFPDTHATDKDWTHSFGSPNHCGKDCFALDLNYSPSGLGASNSNMDYLMPVLAVSNGTVELARYDDPTGYGNVVRINHGGFQSLYAHMDPILMVVQGQQVRTGQVIGFISNTSTYTILHHLHFALHNSTNADAAWADLDGTSMQYAPSASAPFSSSSNQLFEEEFAVTDPAGSVGWAAPLTKADGFAKLPPGDRPIPFRLMMHARTGKGPYIAEYAAQLDPKTANPGRLNLALRGWSFGIHTDLVDFPAGTTPVYRHVVGDRFTAITSDTRQGWELVSDVFDDADLPLGTRFIQPILQTSGGFGGGRMDWLRIQESPASRLGGDVRLNAYNRGGVTQLTWTISDATNISKLQVFRATSRAGTYTLLQEITPAGAGSYSYRDRSLTWGAQYFYALVIQQPAGFPRALGPLGPVDTYLLQNIPGLGWSRIYSDMKDVPEWAGYPGLSFDGSGDTYGLINYNSDPVGLLIVPETPVTLRRIEAFFGDNTNDWGGTIIELGTQRQISLGSISNPTLDWSSLPVNRTVAAIGLWFQRTSGDRYFHNAELRFIR